MQLLTVTNIIIITIFPRGSITFAKFYFIFLGGMGAMEGQTSDWWAMLPLQPPLVMIKKFWINI